MDGEAVPPEDLVKHREASDGCFDVDVVEGGPFYPPGHYDTAFSEGFWLMLEPLCAGEDHTIHFCGGSGPTDCSEFCLAVSYTLRVECFFRRGDADSNGNVNITDPIFTLNSLFAGAGALSCPDAADSDDTGEVNITDAVYTLNALFQGGLAPPSPGPDGCGPDPTPDDLEACAPTCL
jgi:hypothetical protein